MIEAQVEAVLFPLLENHSFDEILESLSSYVGTQAQLAKLLSQDFACSQWQNQASAIAQACAVLSDQSLAMTER